MNSLIIDLEIKKLGLILNYKEHLSINSNKVLSLWKMEIDDQPIFRYIYRNFNPKRHLEFGTWQGAGLIYCLEECNATVWTINKPFGEKNDKGINSYGLYPEEIEMAKIWAKKIGYEIKNDYVTDSIGFIGRFYIENSMGHRVNQIYCDSRNWDASNYPIGFFDSVLIDGGHQTEIIIEDTYKSLPMLRKGGIMMWHDYCPPVYEKFECVKGVMDAIDIMKDKLSEEFESLYWINPSWILLGVKK